MIAAPSLGDKVPSAQAASTAAEALLASAADSIFGRSKVTGRSRLGGTSRSRHSRSAVASPSFAAAIAVLVMASASPSNNASTASVVWLREPLDDQLDFRS